MNANSHIYQAVQFVFSVIGIGVYCNLLRC
jgi:hypothetical protein